MDSRRKGDALSCFSGWWRSWPVLASEGRDGADCPCAGANSDETADFEIWAAELAAPGDGLRGKAD